MRPAFAGHRGRFMAISLALFGSAGAACGSTESRALPDEQRRVQAAVDDFLATHDIVGASVAVLRDGKLTTLVSGHVDLERTEPIGTDDQFRVASITKTYIAALALSMAADGLVLLDEPIDPWITEVGSIARFRGVTLRQLLTHTSGLAQTPTDDGDRGRPLSLDDVIEGIPAPVCDPGTCWSYADGNYVLAAIALDAASPTSLTDEIRDRFLTPLVLVHTNFFGQPEARPVPSYVLTVDPTAFEPRSPHELRRQSLPIVTDARAAPIVTTAADLARWADALYRGRAIGAAQVSELLDVAATRDLPCPQGCGPPYGLGVFHYEFGGREFVGHDGSSGAIVATDRESGLTIAILTNGGDSDVGAFFEAVLTAVDET